jgi:hypothetical protein
VENPSQTKLLQLPQREAALSWDWVYPARKLLLKSTQRIGQKIHFSLVFAVSWNVYKVVFVVLPAITGEITRNF